MEPISNYTYINNLDGLTKPYGYQKITIKNGKTILTHKDGIQITEVSGISKARILSLGELFEIAQQTNQNLSEENLRAFIERNIETYREEINSSCQTVDEVINYVLQDFTELNYNKYILTYITVLIMVEDYGIESAYDILLPSYLYQNLDNDGNTTK